MIMLMFVDRYTKKALLVRLVLQLLIVRNIVPLYELKDIENFDVEQSYIFIFT